MPVHSRPANRGEAKPLIGLYAESGAGKTLSSLYLARGFVGERGTIGMIETESGRGEAFADMIPGGYNVIPLRDSYSPREYEEAITQFEKEGVDALIIDSGSHEWDAVGGVCHMAAMREAEGAKGMLIWQEPKIEHRRHFVLRMLGTPIPLVILCMRARYAMEEKLIQGKREWVRATVLTPFQSDGILYEMFLHGWIDQGHNFHGTKYTREDLKGVIRDGEPITYDTGRRLAAWAKGESPVPYPNPPFTNPGPGRPPEPTTGRTPVDDWEDQLDNVKTPTQRGALWARITPVWGSFLGPEQKRLVTAHERAKQRVGG